MKNYRSVSLLLLVLIIYSCQPAAEKQPELSQTDTIAVAEKEPEIIAEPQSPLTGADKINTAGILPEALITYAQSLIGTPYKYGSTDPNVGFDCSGFITYVFNHFNIKVPRSSKDFEHAANDVSLEQALPGDLILFTGTDPSDRTIGHMGIVVKADGGAIDFIHSSSGKANGVVITPLNDYYMGRFVKVIRVFEKLSS